ncbi:MAG: hypothetical protein M1820_010083 [Bogoriella megaspora]|nr:MAG: hypothetical protein M1820_010083 [Bogoriella megaspora]
MDPENEDYAHSVLWQASRDFDIRRFEWNGRPSKRDQVASRYLKQTPTELAREVLAKTPRCKSVTRHSHSSNLNEVTEILCFYKPSLLDALIEGTIAEQKHEDEDIGKQLSEIEHETTTCPGIYYQALVDEFGHSPLPRQLLEMCHLLRKYANDQHQNVISVIDAHRTHRKGIRKPVTQDSQVYLRCAKEKRIIPSRIHQILDFCDALEKRITSMKNSQRSVPMAGPLVLVGYSTNVKRRQREHQGHRSSNHIMNLAENICQILHGRDFHMDSSVVFPIKNPRHVELAEIVITRITQATTDVGGGFCHYPAGCNNPMPKEWSKTTPAKKCERPLAPKKLKKTCRDACLADKHEVEGRRHLPMKKKTLETGRKHVIQNNRDELGATANSIIRQQHRHK